MKSLVILGATSFIGNTIINNYQTLPIKAVSQHLPKTHNIKQKNISWYEANLLNPGTLDFILEQGDIVINLVYMHDRNWKDNNLLLKNILDSCCRKSVARMIYCSTAGVVGCTKESQITEITACLPKSNYEYIKYNLEQQLLQNKLKKIDIGILRPTSVVGPGGNSLLKLALDLKSSSWFMNYLRASLYNTRPMYLVSVMNVSYALLHLAFIQKPLKNNIYIVSSDEDPNNNFKQVEDCLIQSMGLKKRSFPIIPIPNIVLSLILRLRGRSHFNMMRKYSSQKLKSTGFVEIESVLSAVQSFGVSIK